MPEARLGRFCMCGIPLVSRILSPCAGLHPFPHRLPLTAIVLGIAFVAEAMLGTPKNLDWWCFAAVLAAPCRQCVASPAYRLPWVGAWWVTPIRWTSHLKPSGFKLRGSVQQGTNRVQQVCLSQVFAIAPLHPPIAVTGNHRTEHRILSGKEETLGMFWGRCLELELGRSAVDQRSCRGLQA